MSDVSAPSPPAGRAAPPVAPASVRWLCRLAFVGLIAWLARTGGLHVQMRTPDFEYFYKAGRHLLEKGALDPGYDVVNGQILRRGALDWYWPFVHRMMAALAFLPFEPAGFVWLGINALAFVACVRLLGRWLSGLPPQDWPVTQLVPVLVLGSFWWWEFRLNQVNTLTLLLMVGSYVCWESGRRRSAGFWLGLAVLIKLTPVLLVVWFGLKRELRVVAIAVLTVVLAGPAADSVILGPESTRDVYRAWFERAVTTGSQRGLILSQSEVDWRNQGLGAVLTRWLHRAGYQTHFDNDPRLLREFGAAREQRLNVADLPLTTLAGAVSIIVVALLAWLVWLARRPAARMTPWELRFEWALFLVAALVLMPVLRRYHFIWLLPALTIIFGALHYRAALGGWAWLAGSTLLVLTAVQSTTLVTQVRGEPERLAAAGQRFEAAGTLLAAAVLVGASLAGMRILLRRRPSLLPQPDVATPARHRPRVTLE